MLVSTLMAVVVFISLWMLWLPTAMLLIADDSRRALPDLAASVALALLTGCVSMTLLIAGLLGVPLGFWPVATVCVLMALPGAWRCWRAKIRFRTGSLSGLEWLAFGLLALIALVIVVDAAIWPFFRDDAVAIYRPQAVALFESGRLIPLHGRDTLYGAYPMLLQMNYAFVMFAAGWPSDYAAKLIAALLGAACLPVAFRLGVLVDGRRAGWLAALLLGLTPTFGRWATSGSVDLPMAFFYCLSAVFALRLWHDARLQDALLAGLMIGLAAWTKNTALIGLPVLALWLAVGLLRRRIHVRHALLSLGAAAIVIAPWYLRVWLETGLIVPPTAWTDQASRTLNSLFAFVLLPGTYGPSGWLFVAGFAWAVMRVLRERWRAAESMLLLLWAVPLFGAWWLLASYDPRLLLPTMPLFAVMGGHLLSSGMMHVPSGLTRPVTGLAIVSACILTGFILFNTLEYKDDLLRNPFMTDAERRQLVTAVAAPGPPP